jgi:hypothetical protein
VPDSTAIFNIMLRSIFIGFGFIIPILSLIRTSNLKVIEFKQLFTLTAVKTIKVAGILYFVLWVAQVADAHFSKTNAQVDFMGPYWIYYWYSPLMYLLLTQLFWIKKLHIKKAALITLGLLLLILPSQPFLLYITASRETDYLLHKWSLTAGTMALELLLCIIVFIFIIFTIILIGNKFKNKKA